MFYRLAWAADNQTICSLKERFSSSDVLHNLGNSFKIMSDGRKYADSP